MQPPADFRTRVRAVRLESKSFLQAVRAERLARARDSIESPGRSPNETETRASERPVVADDQLPEMDASRGVPVVQELTVSANAARVSRLAQASDLPEAEAGSPLTAEDDRSEGLDDSSDADAAAPVALTAEASEDSLNDTSGNMTAEPDDLDQSPPSEGEVAAEPETVEETIPAIEQPPEPAAAEEAVEVLAPAEPDLAPVFSLHQTSSAEAGDSDLTDLPGAGPGLIWMLGKIGIHSQKDLAGADADDVGVRLGVIGQLLDLRGWIACAKRNVEAENGNVSPDP